MRWLPVALALLALLLGVACETEFPVRRDVEQECVPEYGRVPPPSSLLPILSYCSAFQEDKCVQACKVFMLALEYPLCISGTNTAAPVCRSTCTQFEELCGASVRCSAFSGDDTLCTEGPLGTDSPYLPPPPPQSSDSGSFSPSFSGSGSGWWGDSSSSSWWGGSSSSSGWWGDSSSSSSGWWDDSSSSSGFGSGSSSSSEWWDDSSSSSRFGSGSSSSSEWWDDS